MFRLFLKRGKRQYINNFRQNKTKLPLFQNNLENFVTQQENKISYLND